MTVPILPDSLTELRAWLQGVEDRLTNIETPNQPGALYRIASTNLTAANAATYVNSVVYCNDINQLAYSSGSHWYKIAVGSLII